MAKRVLVVDDSVTIQKAFAMTFAAEDLTLVSARSAEEGLALAQRSRPDLIVADGVMAGRSGYDLCALIKSDPGLRGVPVYILTSSHNPYDELQGRHVAADGHLVKPFDSGALIASVGEALRKGVVASLPTTAPAAATSAPSHTSGVYATLGDDYGEISVGSGSGVRAGATVPARASEVEIATPPPAAPLPPAPARPTLAPATAASPAGGMRPSLIPGLRPGIPTARPGTVPTRGPGVPGASPASYAAVAAPASVPVPGSVPAPGAFPRGPGPQPPPAGMRTMVGLPAAHLQVPPRAPGSMAPPTTTPPPLRPIGGAPAGFDRAVDRSVDRSGVAGPHPSVSPALAGNIADAAAARVAEKMSQIAARGPEYEAIARLSREIIERIAREIIPGLAEAIIREELQKRGR
ncbi:MAG TPA: response regulator [Polyangia bacterium]